MKKFVFVVCLLVALVAFATDFKVVDPMFTPEPKPNKGGTLTLRLSGSPQSWLFYGSLDNNAYTVCYNLFDPLIEANPVTNELGPGLAKSWEVSEDGLEVTFHLRDVNWTDGVPFTADDVIFTFENFVMNKYARGNSIDRFTLQGKTIEWVKVNDKTLVAKLPYPYGAFFFVTSHVLIYPKHVVAPLIDLSDPDSVNKALTTDTPVNKIVGTGSFILSQYVVDQKVVLKKNPNGWKKDQYGNQLPYVDELVYLIVKDAEVNVAKFLAGEIDYMSLNARDYSNFKIKEREGAPIKVFKALPTGNTPSPVHIAINFDNKDPELKALFRTDAFRFALEYALDRDRIIDQVFNTLATYGDSVYPTNAMWYSKYVDKLRRPYDLKKAAAILDELGLTDKNKDGWRELPSGKILEFTIIMNNASKSEQDIALIYQEDLKSIGVKLNTQPLDSSIRRQKATGGDFDLCIWAFGTQPDPQLRKAIWQPGGSLYYWHLSLFNKDNPDAPFMDDMTSWETVLWYVWEKAALEMDLARRQHLYYIYQDIYAEMLPVIFVVREMDVRAGNNKLGNMYQTESGAFVFTNYTVFKK